MKRRQFALSVATFTAVPASLWTKVALAQAASEPQAGRQYVELQTPVDVEAPKEKIEVVEFFSYTCNHCRDFAPIVHQWEKKLPQDVAFRGVPVAFNKGMVPMQKLYYALVTMGKIDEFQQKVFNSVWVDRVRLGTDAQVQEWAEKQSGLDAAKFKDAYNSFDVANRTARATALQDAYKIEGTPTMGVAGRYWTDGGRAGGSHQAALNVVDYLIEKERQKMAGK